MRTRRPVSKYSQTSGFQLFGVLRPLVSRSLRIVENFEVDFAVAVAVNFFASDEAAIENRRGVHDVIEIAVGCFVERAAFVVVVTNHVAHAVAVQICFAANEHEAEHRRLANLFVDFAYVWNFVTRGVVFADFAPRQCGVAKVVDVGQVWMVAWRCSSGRGLLRR